MPTDEIDKIRACIGRKVTFTYPNLEGIRRGIIRDRAVFQSHFESEGVPYWDVVDLIEFENEEEPECIRIGYYRKPGQRLIWGSQTTITEPVSIWKKMLVKVAREKTVVS